MLVTKIRNLYICESKKPCKSQYLHTLAKFIIIKQRHSAFLKGLFFRMKKKFSQTKQNKYAKICNRKRDPGRR